MKYMFAAGLLAAFVFVGMGEASGKRGCVTGTALGFVTIQSDPLYLVGTIPNRFTSRQVFFSSRYNCKGFPPSVKRVGLGLYDVLFPRLSIHAASATAVSDEGITASYWPLGNGIVRVALRGPLGGADVATRRDVPFSLVVY